MSQSAMSAVRMETVPKFDELVQNLKRQTGRSTVINYTDHGKLGCWKRSSVREVLNPEN